MSVCPSPLLPAFVRPIPLLQKKLRGSGSEHYAEESVCVTWMAPALGGR